ncbi:MAG: pilus assembly protein N-terminal domain-containing protein [Fimbriimonadaceae bacterium]|nr:pilus assembly protein N-terminal domain-containing protein [Alphaproteobacteria bacterium]
MPRLIGQKRFMSFACSCLAAVGMIIGTFPIPSNSAQAAETMLIHVDQARILRLDHPASTIVIGNPMIADAAVQDEQMLVITGKSYGTTNLIVLDRDGHEILSTDLEVRYTASSQVTIQRGIDRYSYSCSPSCEPTLMIGDNIAQFKAVKEAIDGRIQTATGGSSPSTNPN